MFLMTVGVQVPVMRYNQLLPAGHKRGKSPIDNIFKEMTRRVRNRHCGVDNGDKYIGKVKYHGAGLCYRKILFHGSVSMGRSTVAGGRKCDLRTVI